MTVRGTVRTHPWIFWPAALLLCVAAALATARIHLGRTRTRLDRERGNLARMERVEEEWLTARRRIVDMQLAPAGTLNASKIDLVAAETGIGDRIHTSTVPAVRHDGNITEQTVALSLENVRRQQLAEFLNAVEKLHPAIKTKWLQIRTRRATNDQAPLIDAEVQFSAYETASDTNG